MKFSLSRRKSTSTDDLKIPEHVAIIMDGNGRWAKKRGLPRIAGHRTGADSVRQIVKSCEKVGVKFLTLYAFSSENWSRPEKEVDALMGLLEKFLRDRLPEMMEDNVRLKAIGRLDMLPQHVRQQLDEAIEETSGNTSITMILALSYGGREEIVDAAKAIAAKAAAGELLPEDIDNSTIAKHLYTEGIPDPDLLIRTSGEVRLSNFLLWQLSYAEIVITQKNWPEFRHKEFIIALQEFTRRDRRFGKVAEH